LVYDISGNHTCTVYIMILSDMLPSVKIIDAVYVLEMSNPRIASFQLLFCQEF